MAIYIYFKKNMGSNSFSQATQKYGPSISYSINSQKLFVCQNGPRNPFNSKLKGNSKPTNWSASAWGWTAWPSTPDSPHLLLLVSSFESQQLIEFHPRLCSCLPQTLLLLWYVSRLESCCSLLFFPSKGWRWWGVLLHKEILVLLTDTLPVYACGEVVCPSVWMRTKKSAAQSFPMEDQRLNYLYQGSASILCKGPESEEFRLLGHWCLTISDFVA